MTADIISDRELRRRRLARWLDDTYDKVELKLTSDNLKGAFTDTQGRVIRLGEDEEPPFSPAAGRLSTFALGFLVGMKKGKEDEE